MVLYALRSCNEVASCIARSQLSLELFISNFHMLRLCYVAPLQRPESHKPAAMASAWNSFRFRVTAEGARAQPAAIYFPNLCCSPAFTRYSLACNCAAVCMHSVNRIVNATYVFCWVRCCGDNCVDSIFSCLLHTNAPFRIWVCFGVVALELYRHGAWRRCCRWVRDFFDIFVP